MSDKLPGYSKIWNVSFPIVLSLVAQNAINVTDTAFLGRVGEIELGASAIAGLFYISIYMLGFGFSIGGQILIARRNGEKNYGEIGRITDNSFYFLMGLAVILFLIIFFFAPLMLKPLIESPQIYQASVDFLKYRIFGIFFALGVVLLRSFYIGITHTRILTVASIIMAGSNIILDYGLIFGHLGLPEMGIKGAALASSISECIAAVFYFIYTFKKVDRNKYNLFRFGPVDWTIIRKTFNISVFIMMQTFLSLIGWFIFFMIIEKLGERALAVSNIVRSIYIVIMIPVFAFGSTTNSLVSNMIGAGDSRHVLSVVKKISILNFLIILSFTAVFALIPHLVVSVYTTDPSLIADTVPVLYVVMGALTLFSFSSILFNAVSGTARTEVALLIEVITIGIYLLTAYILAVSFNMPLYIVWTSEFVYFLIIGTLSYAYMKSGHWKKVKNAVS
mgnify:FL=1|jgi:putative MATE family efflux protein